jgi:signal transduction histidine kinase
VLEDNVPVALFDALDTGVALLDPDLTVRYTNARWREWLGFDIPSHASVSVILGENAETLTRELRELWRDGENRSLTMTLHPVLADAPGWRLEAVARRVDDGIIIEASGTHESHTPMHDIARRLAEVNDMAEVLSTLCDIAMLQCGGSGAAVLRVVGRQGEVVAAAGQMAISRGRAFELEGSLLKEAMKGLDVIQEPNYGSSGRPLLRVVPDLALGALLLAPLRAHGETLGVLAVARTAGDRGFRSSEIDRLRVLADHAALAVHKSLLLMQAQAADRAKGRFLATMSHELRTPLTALAGYNELLADQVIGPLSDPQLDILERMRSVTIHLSAMIEEILAFTSLEEGREIVRPTEFLVGDLVNAAIAVVQPLAEHKGLTITAALPREHTRMTSDVDKSRQILVNLIGNAVKFTDSGTIAVRVRLIGDGVRIEIRDPGIGIPEEELLRLFRPFAQVDTGLTRRHGGTGLGLYISRRLATLLKGHIEVESRVNVGSTFTVVLPLNWA